MALATGNARTVVLARHLAQVNKPNQAANDWNPGAILTDAAPATADRILATHLAGTKFVRAVHSPLTRAMQTCALLAPDVADKASVILLGPTDFKAWDFLLEMKGAMAKEAWGLNPTMMEAIGQGVAAVVTDIAEAIKDGEVALVVTHNPFAEMGTAALLGCAAPPQEFGKGDLHVFRFEGTELISHEHLPLHAS